MTVQVAVRDDLAQLGFDEDGGAVIARRFYLIAENKAGRRWAHAHCETDREQRRDPEDGYYWARLDDEEVMGRMEAFRRRVQAHLDAGGKLDREMWAEIEPVYGSARYQTLDAVGHHRALERQRERDAGYHIEPDYWDWVASLHAAD